MVNLASLSSKLYCLCHLSVLTVFLSVSVSHLFFPVESNAGFRSYQYSYEYTIT